MLNRRMLLGAGMAALSGLRAEGAVPGLRAIADARGVLFGTAAGSYQLKDGDFQAALAREADILVPEYEQVREAIEPEPGRFDFAGADLLTSFAGRSGMAMHGHTLVWYAANPKWLDKKVAHAPDDEIFTYYIAKVMKHYAGAYRSWDVVNEAIRPQDGRADGLRASQWLKRFGPGYIDTAFHAAKQADPKALLVYSDWGCEGGEAWNDVFRAKTLQLLEGLKARAVPVEALGLQGHLNGFGPPVDQAKLRMFLDRVKALGLKILVTELDVDDTKAPREIVARDQAVADATARFLDVVMDNPATVAVLTWGLTDRYLPKPEWLKGLPGYAPRKLPLDTDLRHKPMWNAIARAFGRR
jgi:endo-1,4-beta-xylanase